MRIGELANATGVRVETIRFYEAEGVLPATTRTSGNYRVYNRDHLQRLSFVKRSRDLGFTLDQVRLLLRLADDTDAPCAEVDALATDHIKQIDRKISDLRSLRRELASRLNNCSDGRIANCGIIESLGAENALDEKA